jgi:IstB-like ATP binding protein
VFEDVARQARDAHWPHEDYLHEVLSAEQTSRHESVMRQRLHEARFPEVKTLDTFDFSASEGVNATQLHTLARGEWVTAPENLIFAGSLGTGKTHLAIAPRFDVWAVSREVLRRDDDVLSARGRAAVQETVVQQTYLGLGPTGALLVITSSWVRQTYRSVPRNVVT